MKPEFHYTINGDEAQFEVICGTREEAERLQLEFPAICGSPLRRVGDTLHFTVPRDSLEGALLQIEGARYPTIDLAEFPPYSDA